MIDIVSPRIALAQNPAFPCPEEILAEQRIVQVNFYTFEGLLRYGSIVVHRKLVEDVEEVFYNILAKSFPLTSVIPVAHEKFKWGDELSMLHNNTSGFNYRLIAGTNRLSGHGNGTAIDINPRLNPWVKDGAVKPSNGFYDPSVPGTLTPDCFVVRFLKTHGWNWGGDWEDLKDYQHFEKDIGPS